MLDEEERNINFVEDLPYKLGDEMIIKDDDFGVFYIDTFESRERYEGKIVEFNCMSVLSDKLPPNTFVAGRLAMTCCADDIQYSGMICVFKNNIKLNTRDWITIKGKIKIEHHKLYQIKGPIVYVESTEFAVPPKQEVAKFY